MKLFLGLIFLLTSQVALAGTGRIIDASIADNASIRNSKMQSIPSHTILGNSGGSPGPATAITTSTLTGLLDVMQFKGDWDASTNIPALVNGTGKNGDTYRASVAGTVNFGAGPVAFSIGGLAVYNGSIWQATGGSGGVVTSVNGSSGVVSLTTADIPENTNLYYTSSRFNSAFGTKSTSDLAEGSQKYFTDARAIGSLLAGYPPTPAPGVVASTDSIFGAIDKLDGNQIASKAAAMKYLGAWDNSTNYLVNDVVTSDGIQYVCIGNNHSGHPAEQPTLWTPAYALQFPMLVPNGGTSSSPTIAFNESGADTGIYSTGDGNLSLANNAVNTASFNPGLITFNVPISAPSIDVPGLWRTGGNTGTGGGAVLGTTDAQPWTTIAGGVYVDSYNIDGSVSSILNITQPDSTNFSQKRNQVNLSVAVPITSGNFFSQNNSVGYDSAFDYAGGISGVASNVDNGSPNTVNYVSATENNINLHGGGTTSLVKGIDMNAGVTGATVGYWAGIASYMNMGSGSHGTGRAFEAGYTIADSTTTGWDLFGGNLNLSGTTANSGNAQGMGVQVSLHDTSHTDNVNVVNSGVDLNDNSTANGINGISSNVVTRNSSAVSNQIFGVSNSVTAADASTNAGLTGENINVQLQGTSASGGAVALNPGISLQDTATSSSVNGINMNAQASGGSSVGNWTTGNFTGRIYGTAHVDNYSGVFIGDTLQNNATVTNFSPLSVNAQIQDSAVVTNGVTVINANLQSSTTLQNATGLRVDLQNAPVSDATQKQTIQAYGGGSSFGYDFTIPPSATFLGVHSMGANMSIANGSPISSLGFIVNFGGSLAAHDDWTADFTGIGLGDTPVSSVQQIVIDPGKTLAAFTGMLSGLNDVGGAGTINSAYSYKAAGVIPGGGSPTVLKEVGFGALQTMCGLSSGNCWAFLDETSGAENYLGKLAVGTASKKVSSGISLEVSNGDVKIDGNIRDSSSVSSVLPTDRQLKNTSAATILNWGNSTLEAPSGLTVTGAASATEGVKIDTAGAQPGCDLGHRGVLWLIQGGAGVADDLQVCMKDAADTYNWVTK